MCQLSTSRCLDFSSGRVRTPSGGIEPEEVSASIGADKKDLIAPARRNRRHVVQRTGGGVISRVRGAAPRKSRLPPRQGCLSRRADAGNIELPIRRPVPQHSAGVSLIQPQRPEARTIGCDLPQDVARVLLSIVFKR